MVADTGWAYARTEIVRHVVSVYPLEIQLADAMTIGVDSEPFPGYRDLGADGRL